MEGLYCAPKPVSIGLLWPQHSPSTPLYLGFHSKCFGIQSLGPVDGPVHEVHGLHSLLLDTVVCHRLCAQETRKSISLHKGWVKKTLTKWIWKFCSMKWYQIHNFFFVKSYASFPLRKMKKFIKKKKKKLSNQGNIKMLDKNCLRNSKDKLYNFLT